MTKLFIIKEIKSQLQSKAKRQNKHATQLRFSGRISLYLMTICNSKGVIRGDETAENYQPALQLPSALNIFLASFSPLFWFKNAATTQFLLSLTSVLIVLSDLSTSFVTYLLTYLHTETGTLCAGNTM